MSKKVIISNDQVIKTSLIVDSVDNAKAQVIFAHGAGADMSHEFMAEITRLLNKSAINVLRFNFPFMDKRIQLGKRYPPDRMPKLLTCYQGVIEQVIADLNNKQPRLPLFIGGKSMGSRVAVTLVSDADILKASLLDKISGVFCLGYPFHPAKNPEKLRLEPLLASVKPVLIVQGERDSLGNKEEITDYKLPSNCECVYLEDGDHSLKPRVKSGFTLKQHMTTSVCEITKFIERNQSR